VKGGRAVTLLIAGLLFAGFGAALALLAVGFSIGQFCSPEASGFLSMKSSTCRVIGDYEGNDGRFIIDISSVLLGALAGILLVVRQSRRKHV
jgi:hypothetical protein